MAGSPLYSRELLGLAVELADHPFDPSAPLQTEARSRTCGSTLALSIRLSDSAIERVGLRVSACAVGQAAAAIFASGSTGLDAARLAAAELALAAWLEGRGERPDWPRLEMLAPVLEYPARHEAILLPWRAARAALSLPATGS